MERPLTKNTTMVDNLFHFFRAFLDFSQQSCLEFSTSREQLRDITIDHQAMQRQWFYQTCTEFGYFQTAPKENPLRPRSITKQYHLDLCKAVFDADLVPNVTRTNLNYMGTDSQGTNIVFTNGGIDPWRMLSIVPVSDTNKTDDGRAARQRWTVILMENESHCSDLYEPSPEDPLVLVKAREEIDRVVGLWIDPSHALDEQSKTHNYVASTTVLFVFSGIAAVITLVFIFLFIRRQQQVHFTATPFH
jgi:hypothetical protein